MKTTFSLTHFLFNWIQRIVPHANWIWETRRKKNRFEWTLLLTVSQCVRVFGADFCIWWYSHKPTNFQSKPWVLKVLIYLWQIQTQFTYPRKTCPKIFVEIMTAIVPNGTHFVCVWRNDSYFFLVIDMRRQAMAKKKNVLQMQMN